MVPTAVGLNAKALPSVLQVIRLTHRICTAAIGGPRRATSDADQPGDGRRVEDQSGTRHADAGSHAWCPQRPPETSGHRFGGGFQRCQVGEILSSDCNLVPFDSQVAGQRAAGGLFSVEIGNLCAFFCQADHIGPTDPNGTPSHNRRLVSEAVHLLEPLAQSVRADIPTVAVRFRGRSRTGQDRCPICASLCQYRWPAVRRI